MKWNIKKLEKWIEILKTDKIGWNVTSRELNKEIERERKEIELEDH